MALYNTAGLLSFIKQQSRRPTTDNEMSDTTWYTYLSKGQRQWMAVLANICPEANLTAPTQITSADGNVTYTFGVDSDGNPITPLGHVELYDGPRGILLRPGTFDDTGCDYVPQGNLVRFPGNVSRTFNNGLYARYVNAQPVDIAFGVEPVMQPVYARELIGYRALILYAEEAGGRDPSQWAAAEQRAWIGRPNAGDFGIVGMLKAQYRDIGMQAIAAPSNAWWRVRGWGVTG